MAVILRSIPNDGFTRHEAYALADWFAERDADESLPAEVLAVGYRWHIWHQPSGYRSLHLNESSFRLHTPGLVIAVVRGNAFAYALPNDARPSDDTDLYVAPFPGLGRHGWIRGWSPDRREIAMPDCMADVMRSLDRCALSTVDEDWAPSCKHPMGVDKLWVEMIQRRWKRFPVKYLRRTPYTLGGLVEMVRAGRSFSACQRHGLD